MRVDGQKTSQQEVLRSAHKGTNEGMPAMYRAFVGLCWHLKLGQRCCERGRSVQYAAG